MKTIYLDLFSGISGDMFIGALIDLGLDFHQLEHELARLGLDEYHLHVSRQERGSIAGTKFDVHLEENHHHHEDEPHHHHHVPGEHSHAQTPGHRHAVHSHPHAHGDHVHGEHTHDKHGHDCHARSFGDIREVIAASKLSEWVKQKSLAGFQRIAEAEGRIHGKPPQEVHFHEVGAVDSIVDIIGACIGLELLGRPRLMAGPVVDGTGWIQCAHGRFPVPAPATLEILRGRGISISQCDEPHELVTPTGAALLAELVENFGPMRDLKPLKIGYGLGRRQNKTRPNVLRAVLCETGDNAVHDWETDTVAVLQANLDDTSAELLGHFVEKALAHGALDVFHTPVQMKKNRPGVLLTVLCAETDADRFSELVLRETTSFGVRQQRTERRKLRRELTTVPTRFGDVQIKIGRLDGRIIQHAPEFESCRRLAEQHGVAAKDIYHAALRALNV
jgi:uncharacterized protein (TIGR00299 family) protein